MHDSISQSLWFIHTYSQNPNNSIAGKLSTTVAHKQALYDLCSFYFAFADLGGLPLGLRLFFAFSLAKGTFSGALVEPPEPFGLPLGRPDGAFFSTGGNLRGLPLDLFGGSPNSSPSGAAAFFGCPFAFLDGGSSPFSVGDSGGSTAFSSSLMFAKKCSFTLIPVADSRRNG